MTNIMLLVEDYISTMSDSVMVNGTSSLTMTNENLSMNLSISITLVNLFPR